MDRRRLLAGLAAGSATVAGATGAAVALPPDVSADAELIALGRDLDERVAAWNAYRPTYRAAGEARAAAVQDYGPWFRQAKAAGGQAAWWREWRRITGHHDAPIAHGNALSEAVDVPAARIMALTPRTLAGIAVQARAVAWAFAPLDEVAPEDMDYPDEMFARLAANIAALAG